MSNDPYYFVHESAWLSKRRGVRAHVFTLQFLNEAVSADAALTTVVDRDTEHSAGFTQIVSDNGVENFRGSVGISGGGYTGVDFYEMDGFFRTGVTSVTCGLLGGPFARARYNFIVRTIDARAFEAKRAGFGADVVLVFDPANGAVAHHHRVIGDAAFRAAFDLSHATAYSPLAGRVRNLEAIRAPTGMSFDPASDYRVDPTTGAIAKADAGS